MRSKLAARRVPRWGTQATCALASAACYHAVVETGRPTGTLITRRFQPSFIYGLVPPPVANVAGQCPSGVARVETVHGFLEGLVGAVTAGIFTPMTISVTCAAGGTTGAAPDRAAPAGERALRLDQATEAERAAIAAAARRAAQTGRAAYVRF